MEMSWKFYQKLKVAGEFTLTVLIDAKGHHSY